MTGTRLAHQGETKLETEETSKLIASNRLKAFNSNGVRRTREEL